MRQIEAEVAHPYYSASAPAEHRAMLDALGFASADALYSSIPEHLRLRRPVALPPGIAAEADLERHLADILDRDVAVPITRNFRGGGCWPHHVPEVCTEIVNRAEFRTAYWAAQYTDHGKWQAFFEYGSLLGELLEMDAVSLPTYDWANAAATSVRMACRITGRNRIVVAGEIGAQRLGVMQRFAVPDLELVVVPISPISGQCELDRVREALIGAACLYFESPGYLGLIEERGRELCDLAHHAGALVSVGTDPISLGVLAPPSTFGADIVCGDLQPLGVPMQFGGGLSGFIASGDEERFVGEYPGFLIGIVPTGVPGELGFGFVDYQRTSFMRRDLGKDFGGTTTNLWAIAAAVYLSLLGPAGMRELGDVIAKRAAYASRRIGSIPGVRCPSLEGPFFKEFVAEWSGAGLTAAEVNRRLSALGWLGGVDLSLECPQLGQSTLFCVTEVHQQRDIDGLVAAIQHIVTT